MDRKKAESQLQQSEELNSALFNDHAAVMLLIDPNTGEIRDANVAAVDYYGWPRDQLVGMFIQNINTLSPDEVKQEMQRAESRARTFFEFRHRRADASIRDVAVFSSRVHTGEEGLLYSIIHDITDQKKAEAALATRTQVFLLALAVLCLMLLGLVVRLVMILRQRKRAEDALQQKSALLAKAEQLAQLGSWTRDMATNGLTCSDEAYRLFGCTPQELTPTYTGFLERVHPLDRETLACKHSVSVRMGIEADEFEYRILRKDTGEVRYINERCEHVRDASGTVIRTIGICQDITERKLAEHQTTIQLKLIACSAASPLSDLLTMALDEVEQLLNSSISFWHFVEPDQKTLSLQQWSTATLERFCTSQGRGMHYNIDQAGVWVDCVRERKGVIHNDYVSLPHRRGLPEGHAEIVREMVAPVIRQDAIVAIMGVGNKSTDYTPEDLSTLSFLADVIWEIITRKKTEEALRQFNQELEKRVRKRTWELEEANRQLEAFSYSVSHDLRAPLRGLTGLTRILLGKHTTGLSEEGRKLCVLINDNATAMGLLIDDLLFFSQAERTALHVSPINMTAMVRGVFEELGSTEDTARVDFQLQELPPIEADPCLLRQVWLNLLANAVKYSSKKEHPVVQVRAELKDGQAVYHVQDNGAGFDMQHAHKIFDVFKRVHSTKDFAGTGVGLAIVQQIITRHGGRVWAQGEPDKGATFSFTLNVVETERMKSNQQ
ncbi:PAS domain-containing sensor histidine kinase [Desulfonatronum thiodismutans]|uniref:PAS domain-containing sensor histidine kinase n=1 Tax=Desulfonatronum thiodismutans TaxID=159290 RepID=UPI0013781DF7|nr:ATP-binding protein [Desulfonatronum thiodismutans]